MGMRNLTLRYISTILTSLFLGILFGFLSLEIWHKLLYQYYPLESYFGVGFFLGGILAPWLISVWFGTLEKKIVLTSHGITVFFASIFIVSAKNGESMMLALLPVYYGALPLFILSQIFLYLSYRGGTSKR